MSPPQLSLRGAREHNLRDLDLDLPHGQWIAVTGVSGSGKSSLVVDTVAREGQRRFLGSLTARARHYLGKLGRAQVEQVQGLPATIVIGAGALSPHARSTVGTIGGISGLLRVVFARAARDPEGEALSLSSFSFNHPRGACPACDGLGVEDQVDPALLVADTGKSLRQGALRPTLKNGYTVYSQVTLEVMNRICQAHGFDVDTPWVELSQAQRDVIFHGTRALKVPFGKHSLESRLRWEGITARPREEGYYRGLIPVLEETLARNRNENVLRYVRSVPCGACAGTRLARPGRDARLGDHSLPALLALPARQLLTRLDALPADPVWEALRPEVERRLRRMLQLGLGHLALERESTSLSGGEAQRLRLATQLAADLSGLLVALDEPTLGLHPADQDGMRAVLDSLRGLGNTLLVVEHDPDMVRHADLLLSLGPGAGPAGGALLHAGPPPADPLGPPPDPKTVTRPGRGQVVLRGATLHGLREADLTVRLAALNVVLGPSGAGKSSLVLGTLLPALRGEPGGPYRSLEGVPADLGARALDASPIGRTPRSTPATYTGLFDLLRKRFAATAAARERGWTASRFSYNTQAGRCETCAGLGVERIGLHLLADVERPCATCGGGRYAPETLEVELQGLTIADCLGLTVDDALARFADDAPVARLCQALTDLGLGYLRLGQSSTTLSRGEAQRVRLATLLGAPGRSGAQLLILDEPDRGLHPDDVTRLLRSLDALVDAGHTVLAISHHRHVWAAADHLTELREGRATASPRLSWARLSTARAPRPPASAPPTLELRGVRTHGLRDLNVDIPRGSLTVVAGVSGSGKSSLAFATLAAEAQRRFAESLPFQVRRHLRRLPRPELDGAQGLSPTLALRQRQGRSRPGPRSTVATQTELGPLLRLLWSRAGRIEGRPHGLSASHFSPDQPLGACPDCAGLGVVQRCDPQRLVTHPDASLLDGALGGTKPGRFFGDPDGQHLATLRAAAPSADLSQPWRALPESVRALALHGAGAQVLSVRWRYRRGQRTGEHALETTWDGLCALVEREARLRAGRKDAAAWAEPLADGPCPACDGARLRPGPRAVQLGGRTLPALFALPLAEVGLALAGPLADPGAEAARAALAPELEGRIDDLRALGLGHLTLDRPARTLSDGELQRVRLASVLRAGLTGLTVVLDEPGAGLHARDLGRLLERLRALRDAGNTLVVVSHRPALLRAADHLLELGPGAGAAGGRLVGSGPPEQVLAGDTLTAEALRAAPTPSSAPRPSQRVELQGARAHTLQGLDVSLPASGFVAVTGVSGSGKSSLIFDVLAASARAQAPIECDATAGLDRFREVRSSREVPGGTPLEALGLLPALQALFHAACTDPALPKRAFSYRSPAGRCPVCKGSGREVVALEVLADLPLPCQACEGQRYRPEVLAVRWEERTIAELLAQPVGTLTPLLPAGALRDGAQALARLGLGHLPFGRPQDELSGGEAQRLVLAATCTRATSPALVLLDEPATGLHEADLTRLVEVLHELAARGDLVVAAVHRLSLIRAADEVLELGPGSGPEGGRVVAQAAPGELRVGATAQALSEAT